MGRSFFEYLWTRLCCECALLNSCCHTAAMVSVGPVFGTVWQSTFYKESIIVKWLTHYEYSTSVKIALIHPRADDLDHDRFIRWGVIMPQRVTQIITFNIQHLFSSDIKNNTVLWCRTSKYFFFFNKHRLQIKLRIHYLWISNFSGMSKNNKRLYRRNIREINLTLYNKNRQNRLTIGGDST